VQQAWDDAWQSAVDTEMKVRGLPANYFSEMSIAGWFSTGDSAYAYLTEAGRVLLGINN
jgi:hypothetical protein